MKYIRNKNKFYFTYKHNNLCDAIEKASTDNIAETNESIKKYSDLKELLINLFK